MIRKTILLLATLLSLTISQTIVAKTTITQDILKEDQKIVIACRKRLTKITNHLKENPQLITPFYQKSHLSSQQIHIVWQLWASFLDIRQILDQLTQYYSKETITTSQETKDTLFAIQYAIFLINYRYSLDLINQLEKYSSISTILNEENPSLGIRKNSYTTFKYTYLNSKKALTFLRKNIQYKKKNTDPKLKKMIQKDIMDPNIIFKLMKNEIQLSKIKINPELHNIIESENKVIFRYGLFKGPLLTIKNVIRKLTNKINNITYPIKRKIITSNEKSIIFRGSKPLITKKQIKVIHSYLEPGDIILIKKEWRLSNIGIPGYWTHIALYTGTIEERDHYFNQNTPKDSSHSLNVNLKKDYPNDYHLSKDQENNLNNHSIIEALTTGITHSTLTSALSMDSVAILRPNVSKKTKEKAILKAFSFLHRPYDFNFDLDSSISLVCSELIYKCYETDATTIGLELPSNKIFGHSIITPNKFAEIAANQKNNRPKQFKFVLFVDGNDIMKKAVHSTEKEFKKSWKRPKWHTINILNQ